MLFHRNKSVYYSLVVVTSSLLASVGCKSTDKKDGKMTVDLKCETTPPTRVDYAEDGKTIFAQGPVDLAGKPCAEVAVTEKAKLATLKTGTWTLYQKDGIAIFQQGEFAAGKKQGLWKTFSVKGNLVRETNYSAGEMDGADALYFDEPGKAWRTEANYKNGKLTGKYRARNKADSACVTEGAYAENLKTGRWRECRIDEKTKADYQSFEGAYLDGMRNGAAKFFFPGGKIESQGNIFADVQCTKNVDEKFAQRFQDKAPGKDDELDRERQKIACEKLVGAWVFFNSNGSKRAEGSYEDGKKSGTWHENYATGAPMATGIYEKGKRMAWTFFSKDGGIVLKADFAGNPLMPRTVELYENGRLTGSGGVAMGTVRYDGEADKLDIQQFTRKGKWIEYHTNGKKSGEGEYAMGKRSGAWKHYDTNGNLIAEGTYSMNEKQGEWRELENGTMVTKKYFMGRPQTIGR